MTYLQKKKRFFLSIVNKLKGFIRSVSGTSPLTIEDCVDNDSIINYSILGKTTQNGVPSYDNCVDFESVGDLVTEYDGGKNLLNPDRNIKDRYITEEGVFTSSTAVSCTDFMEIEPNTKYSLSFLCNYSGAKVRVHEFTDNKNWIRQKYVFESNSAMLNVRSSVSFTTSDDAKYIRISYAPTRFSEVQLEKGEATEYEPYHAEKYGKYRIPIVASGKNLLDLSGINYYNGDQRVRYTSENGYLKLNGTKYGLTQVKFKSGTVENPLLVLEPGTYMFSIRVISGTYTHDFHIDLNGVWGYGTYLNKTTKFTLTEPLTVTYFRGYLERDNNIISNLVLAIQLEKSDQVTEFQPYFEPITTEIYLDEPLRQGMYYDLTNNKVVPYTGYEDYIDFENQKVIRKNYETEFYTTANDYANKGNLMSLQGRDHKVFDSSIKGSYRYDTLGCNYGNLVWSNSNCQIVYMPYANFGVTSKAEFQTYLNQCALIGKPVKVLYRLAIPLEEPISLPKLPSHKGDVIYTVGTTVAPEGMGATYYSYTKE